MKIDWIIIGGVLLFAVLVVVLLIWKNYKDEKEVIEHFNEEASLFHDEESEANDV